MLDSVEYEGLIKWYIHGKERMEKCIGREFAYKVLSDGKQKELYKTKMEQYLYKTKLCKYILKNESCIHGEKCRFAHSKEEICPGKCLFGYNCKHVKFIDGKYENVGGKANKKCIYIHPKENIQNYKNRTKENIGEITVLQI